MMKQIGKMMLLFALLIPAGLVAQDNEQATQMGRPAKQQDRSFSCRGVHGCFPIVCYWCHRHRMASSHTIGQTNLAEFVEKGFEICIIYPYNCGSSCFTCKNKHFLVKKRISW